MLNIGEINLINKIKRFNIIEDLKKNNSTYIYGEQSSEFILNILRDDIEKKRVYLFNLDFKNNFFEINKDSKLSDLEVFDNIKKLNVEINENLLFNQYNQLEIISILKNLNAIEKIKIIAIKIDDEIKNEFLSLITELNIKNYKIIIFSEKNHEFNLNCCIHVKEKSIIKQGLNYNQVFIYTIFFNGIQTNKKQLQIKSLERKNNQSIQVLYKNLEKEVFKQILHNF